MHMVTLLADYTQGQVLAMQSYTDLLDTGQMNI